MDINILATCEESLFLFTVYHLAAAHPFLAGRGKSTIQARGDTGVRLEALCKQILRTPLHVCGGSRSVRNDGREAAGSYQSILRFLCSEPGMELRQTSADLPKSQYSLWVCSPSPRRGSHVSVFCLHYPLQLKSHVSTCLLDSSIFLSYCIIKLHSEFISSMPKLVFLLISPFLFMVTR